MNWLQRLSQLEREWWRNAQHHMTQVLQMKFNPLPRESYSTGGYQGSDIVYLPRRDTPPVGVESFEFELTLRFRLYRQLRLYECFVDLRFDRKMEAFLTYDRRNPIEYRTDRVRGLENIDANLLGIKCYVKRRGIQEQIENQKVIGPSELSGEEMTPYNILETIESLVLSDFDPGSGDEEVDPIPPDYSSSPEEEVHEYSGVLVPR